MKYIILKLMIFYWIMTTNTISAQEIKLKITDDSAYFLEEADSILVYRAAETSLNGLFKRANYIHPLYGLDGTVITEDFPEYHKHHRGVFWAWHQLYIGETRIGDGWELKDLRWEVVSLEEIHSLRAQKTLKTEVFWKSPLWRDHLGNEKPLVKETTSIAVYPKKGTYRAVDIQIELVAMEPDMRLGGSEDVKGYGGFSVRMQLPEDIQFLDANGKVMPQNLPVDGNGWLAFKATMDVSGNATQLVIIPHKDNPGYPNPWILRSKASMQNAVYPDPGAVAVPLSMVKPTRMNYRLLISDGSLTTDSIIELQNSFFIK
ncbi:MAG: DUF6807 family protein [Maribacter arcticus]|uniref:DUF6807 family protein n=1 Tax=Maribacter arcticus TaxID=561365 RepID=UPI0030036247